MMDPTQAASAAPTPSQGKTVCIAAQGDGTFMVYLENPAAEAGGAQEESDEQSGGQAAQDIDSALEAARQLLEDGDSQQGTAAPNSADALFEQGFKQARGTPLNRGDNGDHEYR